MTSLTIPERILVAAAEIQGDKRSFTAEDLVVKAWRMYPEHFGLQGYAENYPDSNRILTKIMGSSSPLRKYGWLEKIGTKKYRLTEVGLLKAREVASRRVGPSEGRLANLSRPLIATLTRLLGSTALTKFPDVKEEITFGDLCAFWNISPRSSANQLAVREAEVQEAIALARERCQVSPMILPGGEYVTTVQELERLQDLNEFLRRRFRLELEVVRRRTDERRL